jgi:hypothetical protein
MRISLKLAVESNLELTETMFSHAILQLYRPMWVVCRLLVCHSQLYLLILRKLLWFGAMIIVLNDENWWSSTS